MLLLSITEQSIPGLRQTETSQTAKALRILWELLQHHTTSEVFVLLTFHPDECNLEKAKYLIWFDLSFHANSSIVINQINLIISTTSLFTTWKNKFRALWKFQRQIYMQRISFRIQFCKGKNQSPFTNQKLSTKGSKRPGYLGGVDGFPKTRVPLLPKTQHQNCERHSATAD